MNQLSSVVSLIKNMPEQVESRFWQKVDKTDTCWLWMGSKNRKGYGQFNWRKLGRPMLAHRIAWIMSYGDDPQSKLILHKCDNPACVNPDHLQVGTAAQNSADMVSKGRSSKGEHHFHAKLTAADVAEVRRIYALRNISQRDLAAMYGVSRPTISAIVVGRNWADVDDNGGANHAVLQNR